jgi:hypothetical protein
LLPLLEPDSDIALRLRNGIGSLDGGAAAKESPAPASPY